MHGVSLPDIKLLDDDLRGKRLPGARFCITPEDVLVLSKLCGSPSSAPSPIFAMVAALRGLGITLDEMCRLCEFELAAGPMLGECAMRFGSQLQQGLFYRTEVEIHGIDRKYSATSGVIDRLRFAVALFAADTDCAAEVELTWLLPRGNP